MRGISGTGNVPCLIAHEAVGDLVLWESLAILEYLVELFSDLPLWPADAADRVRARQETKQPGRAPAILRGGKST